VELDDAAQDTFDLRMPRRSPVRCTCSVNGLNTPAQADVLKYPEKKGNPPAGAWSDWPGG
jgi:hypothetical protein